MRSILAFFKSRTFILNLALAIALISAGVYCVFKSLKTYTKHDVAIMVPSVRNIALLEADSILQELELVAVVIDSVYDEEQRSGIVLKQNPLANEEVKTGRKIYLTITTVEAPSIKMPDLSNLSLRQAISIIEVLGLKLDSVKYRPDVCKDCVLEQRIGNKVVLPGSPVKKGSKISFTLGRGMSTQKIMVPYLEGYNLGEAMKTILSASLGVGSVIYNDCYNGKDSSSAVVSKQSPSFNGTNGISLGGSVDLWLTGKVKSVRRMSTSEIQAIKKKGKSFETKKEEFDYDDYKNWNFSGEDDEDFSE
jgi:beta-lactam-binding protein with PASTA domain